MSKRNKVNDELFNIYIALIKHKLIDTKTAKSEFQNAFRGLELNNIKKKINWTGSFRLLIYFLQDYHIDNISFPRRTTNGKRLKKHSFGTKNQLIQKYAQMYILIFIHLTRNQKMLL